MKTLTVLLIVLLSLTTYSQQKGDGYCGTFSQYTKLSYNPIPRPDIPNERLIVDHEDFIIHYSEGDEAYAEEVFMAAEISYNYYFNLHNWLKPPSDNGNGGDDRYDIYIKHIIPAAKGQAVPEELIQNESWSSWIQIEP